MSQEETNAAKWSNPENWSSPKWVGLYFSMKDRLIRSFGGFQMFYCTKTLGLRRSWMPGPLAMNGERAHHKLLQPTLDCDLPLLSLRSAAFKRG